METVTRRLGWWPKYTAASLAFLCSGLSAYGSNPSTGLDLSARFQTVILPSAAATKLIPSVDASHSGPPASPSNSMRPTREPVVPL